MPCLTEPSALSAALLGLFLATGAWAQTAEPERAPIPITELNIPDIGEPADEALSPKQEAEIGAEVVGRMYQYDYVLDDPELADYLASIGYRLTAASASKPPKLDVFMVRDPRINAFALPGGYMGVNAGLITASASESEVAGVMGHELAHITQRHIARSANSGAGWESLAAFGIMLAAVLSGSADADLIMGSMAIGQSLAYQHQVAYTRAHEQEADRLGIQTMAAASYDPRGMASFFQRLEQQSRLYGSGLPEILRTHPVNTNRIAEAQSRAAQMPSARYVESVEYGFMRARTQVLIADRPGSAIEAFEGAASAGRDTPATHYGIALALNQAGQYERAREQLAPLLGRYSRQANVQLLAATIDSASGKTSEALARYAKILDQYPSYAPGILAYSEALIVAGKPADARSILLTQEQAYGRRTETYRLLARAAEAMGNQAESTYQMANFMFARGDIPSALAQLDAGLRIASISTEDRARLAAKRAEVRSALPRNFNPEQRERR